MDSRIKEYKLKIKNLNKELSNTKGKLQERKINNQIKSIEKDMQKLAYEMEKESLINRYVARKQRIIENNKNKMREIREQIKNVQLSSDESILLYSFLNNGKKPKSMSENLKEIMKLIKKANNYASKINTANKNISDVVDKKNFDDIKGLDDLILNQKIVKKGKEVFPEKLKNKYFGRSFKSAITLAGEHKIPANKLTTMDLNEEEKKAAQKRKDADLYFKYDDNEKNILELDKQDTNENLEYPNSSDSEKTIESIRQNNEANVTILSTEISQIDSPTKEINVSENNFNISIIRDYLGFSIYRTTPNHNIEEKILDFINRNLEIERDCFDWRNYSSESKSKIKKALKFANEIKCEGGDATLIDGISLECLSRGSSEESTNKEVEKLNAILEQYYDIIRGYKTNSTITYNTKYSSAGIYYKATNNYKQDCINEAIKARKYAKTDIDNGFIARSGIFFKRLYSKLTGKSFATSIPCLKLSNSLEFLEKSNSSSSNSIINGANFELKNNLSNDKQIENKAIDIDLE